MFTGIKNIFKLLFLWLGLTLLVFLFETAFFPQENYDSLLTRGVKVTGVIEEKRPQNHQAITYSYTVDGTKYTGTGASGVGNGQFEDMRVGQSIEIYYDADDPQKSVPGDPRIFVKRKPRTLYFLTIFAPALIIWGLYRFRLL